MEVPPKAIGGFCLFRRVCFWLSVSLFVVGVLGTIAVILITCPPPLIDRAARYALSLSRPSWEAIVSFIFCVRTLLIAFADGRIRNRVLRWAHQAVLFLMWMVMTVMVLPLKSSLRSWIIGWPFFEGGWFERFYNCWVLAVLISLCACITCGHEVTSVKE